MTLEEVMEEVQEACRDMGCEEEWKYILDYMTSLDNENQSLYNEIDNMREENISLIEELDDVKLELEVMNEWHR